MELFGAGKASAVTSCDECYGSSGEWRPCTSRTAAADVRADRNQTTLNGVLEDLERDLRLASGETASVRRAFRTALLP